MVEENQKKEKFCPFKKSDCLGDLCALWIPRYNDKGIWEGDCAFAVLGQDAQERLNLL